MSGHRFARAEDVDEYRRFCLHHARSFGRALPSELWHYTDANGLIGILESGCVWSTQVSCLNDMLEQRYFGDLIHAAVKERKKTNVGSRLGPLFAAADAMLEKRDFSSDAQFVACFSEAEDDLSQWRGYGGGECGYAIAFDSQGIMEATRSRPGSILLPMGYTDSIHSVIVEDVIKWAETYFQQGLDRGHDPARWAEEFVFVFANELALIAATVKHPKFSAESERRVATLLQESDREKLIFRQKRTLLARHLPISLLIEVDGKRRLPITRIYVGPGPSQTVSKISVGDLLLKHRYVGIPVEVSKVPYRVP